MNKEEFIIEVEKLGIKLDEKKLNELEIYYELLVEYNSHTNLTRIVEKEDVYLKHFYDSLTLIKAIKLDKQKLLDIGTGAGFPGLVLKIVFPNLDVTLVDSLNKRVIFLNEVIDKLKLTGIKTYHARAEEFIKDNREKYDIVTSRAVANLNMLSELCIPYVKINGYFIPMKSDVENEIILSKNAIKTLGSVIEDTFVFNLPLDSGKRSLIKIKKISKTSIKYPRKFSEIKKNPL